MISIEKVCSTCNYRSKALVDEPCNSCFIFEDSKNVVGNVIGGVYTKWEPAHTCSTCKHCDKKITEEPCLDCDIRVRNDKWEARE